MSEQLQQEVAELRARLEAADDWASGVHRVLLDVLPHLLRGHPEVAKVQHLLLHADQRYQELLANPASSEGAGDTPGLYEPAKMLYRQLALLGVWPDVDPQAAAQQSLERASQPKP
jgi:hypothetical protein